MSADPATAPILAGLAAGAVPLLPGWALSGLLPRAIRRALVARLGAAWLLGAAWCGATALAASRLGGLPLRRGVLLPLVLVPLAAALVLGRRRLALDRPARPAPVSAVAGAIGGLTCAVLLAHALSTPVTGWDGLMTWVPQVRLMRAERTATPAAFRDPWVWVTHPQYPPLVSLVQVTGLEIVDAPVDERAGRVVFPLFFAAFLALLHRTARLLTRSARAAAVAAALAAMTPFLAFSDHGGAKGAYADVPLAAFLGGALAVLLCGGLRSGAGLAGGLLLAGAVLTKTEGIPLASGLSVLLLLVAVAGLRRRPRAVRRARALRMLRSALAAAVLLGASIALLHAWRAEIPNRYTEDYGAILAATRLEAREIGSKLATVAPSLAAGLFDVTKWGLLWPLLVTLSMVRPGALRRRAALAAGGLVLGPVAIALAAYAVHWNPISLADVSWDRFLVQGAFGTFLLLGLVAAPQTEAPRAS
ncbi:MAG TPA: hypothetical protein VE129_04555 [Thermoanaerobaculia bacterium]|nr:hypothetical protein [Thermoanaerobaculia bacterium]